MSGSVPVTHRLLFLDMARTIALCAMVVFHAVRDLEFFGVIAAGTTLTGGWALFARSIAAGFLFFSGISLVLAHARGFRAQAWARRVAMIAGAACLVSLTTYFAFPSHYIFFGILHAIAVAILLGIPFIRAPAWFPLIGAALVLVVNTFLSRSVFTAPAMAWSSVPSVILLLLSSPAWAQSAVWERAQPTPCTEFGLSEAAKGIECYRVDVPVRHDAPEADTISLAPARIAPLEADGPSDPLFMAQGWPEGATIATYAGGDAAGGETVSLRDPRFRSRTRSLPFVSLGNRYTFRWGGWVSFASKLSVSFMGQTARKKRSA